MDSQLFLAINGLAGRWPWLDWLGVFFAEYFIYVFAAFIGFLWLKKHWRRDVYMSIVSAAISRLVVELLKRWVARPRPYELLPVHQLLIDRERSLSFPSGHAVIFYSFAFAFYGTKYFWPFLILATLGSVARVFTGVHYPVDIMGSVVIAAGTVYVLRQFFKRHYR